MRKTNKKKEEEGEGRGRGETPPQGDDIEPRCTIQAYLVVSFVYVYIKASNVSVGVSGVYLNPSVNQSFI